MCAAGVKSRVGRPRTSGRLVENRERLLVAEVARGHVDDGALGPEDEAQALDEDERRAEEEAEQEELRLPRLAGVGAPRGHLFEGQAHEDRVEQHDRRDARSPRRKVAEPDDALERSVDGADGRAAYPPDEHEDAEELRAPTASPRCGKAREEGGRAPGSEREGGVSRDVRRVRLSARTAQAARAAGAARGGGLPAEGEGDRADRHHVVDDDVGGHDSLATLIRRVHTCRANGGRASQQAGQRSEG
eukprot:7376745-Prymnesium_polylepis.1